MLMIHWIECGLPMEGGVTFGETVFFNQGNLSKGLIADSYLLQALLALESGGVRELLYFRKRIWVEGHLSQWG